MAMRPLAQRARAATGHSTAPTANGSSDLAGVTPGLVPVLARGIDDAAVGLEELVGNLKDRQHQPAFGTPCDMTATRFAPDKFARPRLDSLGPARLVGQM